MERGIKIIHNRCKCKNCGDIIESKTVHNWVCCSCWRNGDHENGCFTDGGTEYIRRGGNPDNYISMDETRLYTDEEVDEYNRKQEELSKKYGSMFMVSYMEK